ECEADEPAQSVIALRPALLSIQGSRRQEGIMEDMNRRDFVIATVGGLGLLNADLARTQQGMHVRHNVYCLNPRGREIRSYATAVTTMQARASTDPTSWSAQAAIHGTLSPT